MCGREVPPAFFSYATINRRLVVDLVKRSANSGMAFLNAVLSNRLLVTVFQAVSYTHLDVYKRQENEPTLLR